MTLVDVSKKSNRLGSLLLLAATVTLGILFSGEMSKYVSEGLVLAVRCVIPSSFPFMIISDFYVNYGGREAPGRIGRAVCYALGIPPCLLGAFVCGNVGGFPIGAKIASETYKKYGLDKRVVERVIPLSSNPSSAFIIGGVGLGMYKDVKVGAVLLIAVYSSMLLCAIITRGALSIFDFTSENTRQKYNFVASVKQSGSSCVTLIAFISAFSVAVGMVKNHVKSVYLSMPIICVLEVTNALKIFADFPAFDLSVRLMLSGFALGFGGLSVMMQSYSFLEGSGLGIRKYLSIKLLQGLLCASISFLLYTLIR